MKIGEDKLFITESLRLIISENALPMEHVEEIQRQILFYIEEFKSKQKQFTPIAVLYNFLRFFNKGNIAKEHRKMITCKKGCSHCCNINVDMGKIEADLIKEYMRQHNLILDREYLEVQKTLPVKERVMSVSHRACTFLNQETGECTIYEVRPIACRKYFVTNEPDKCDAVKYFHSKVSVYAELEMEIIASAIANIDMECSNMAEMLLKD